MGIFDSSAADRLSKLEAEARLADLEIERTKIKDLASLDVQNMTAGEIITLANVIEAIRVITSQRELQPAQYVSPSTSERRGGFGLDSGEQDAEQEARREEALAKLRQLLTGNIPDDAPIETVNGTIRFGDIPRTEDGNVNETWLDANCTCDEHEAKRIEADKAAGKPYADDEIASGLYL